MSRSHVTLENIQLLCYCILGRTWADLDGPRRTSMDLCGPLWSSANLGRIWQTIPDLNGPWRTWAIASESRQTYAELSGPERMLEDLGGPVRIWADLSRSGRTAADPGWITMEANNSIPLGGFHNLRRQVIGRKGSRKSENWST